MKLDEREFSNKFAQATQHLSPEEKQAVFKLFAGISQQLASENPVPQAAGGTANFNDDEEITGLTPRLERLKNAYLNVRPSVFVRRAVVTTEVYRENAGMPIKILRALAFKKACETAPLLIQQDELIIGHPCGKPRAGCVSPEISWRWVRDELDTMSTRAQDPFQISEEDKQTLREKVFPFWEGKSVDEICQKQYEEAGVWSFSGESFVSDLSYHQVNGGGDTCPGYDVILVKKGINGIKREAEEKLAALSMEKPEDIDKIYFYKAEILVCEGVLAYSRRLSDYARQLGDRENDNRRRQELYKLADIMAHVPANPPRTFHEGLQAVWTMESLFNVAENQTGISLGRVDQYLYPVYKADREAGRLTKKEAFELFAALSSNARKSCGCPVKRLLNTLQAISLSSTAQSAGRSAPVETLATI